MTKTFLEEYPEVRSRCKYDFLEIYSGPNAPTTAAVVKALRSEPDLAVWFDNALRLSGIWYHQDQDSESESEDSTLPEQGIRSENKGIESDSSFHLLEDEEKVSGILRNLPTEEYYHILRKRLQADFAGARPDVIEHISELEEFFDVCLAIGFSLGINKMELLKTRVKLLGEIVTREGRMPDPVKVAAIRAWGPINNLKEVQEFLGTCNYSRLTMGPKYSLAAEGLRRYVKEGDAAFPMTPRGLAAVERLKGLVCESTLLAIPDE
jgi:hypothetical protein